MVFSVMFLWIINIKHDSEHQAFTCIRTFTHRTYYDSVLLGEILKNYLWLKNCKFWYVSCEIELLNQYIINNTSNIPWYDTEAGTHII